MIIRKICLAALLSLPVFLHAETPPPSLIAVDATTSLGAVNRLVFGQNVVAADDARLWSSDKTNMALLQTGNGFWDPEKRAFNPDVIKSTIDVGAALLRYPGGCNVHNYDWRKAVGPIETRGDWKFGVDEYLALCKTVGAEPMFTISDYVLPADELPAYAAGLVEYLNAPATSAHPWAMKRKEWGHAAPYGVKLFEMGNETDHGNHRLIPFRKYSAEEYAAYANTTAAAMRAVDPSIKIGIVMQAGTGVDANSSWNRTVAHLAGKSADCLIVHLYAPDVSTSTAKPDFFRACMAVGEQSEKHLDEYRAMALKESGRNLSIVITEYNGSLSPERIPDRFSYAEALECADLMRIILQPEHHVLSASYWEFLNGLFGMLRSEGGKIVEKPAYPLYRLWAQHLGTRLAAIHVDSPRSPFEGAGSVYPAEGDTYTPSGSLGMLPTDGQIHFGNLKPGITGEGGTNGAFSLHSDGVTGNNYLQVASLPKPATTGACDYVVNFEARFVPDAGSATVPVGINIGDARGWAVTRSMIEIDRIGGEWKTFRALYHAEPDTAAITVQAHMDFGSAKISGRLEVRGFQIEALSAPRFPAYALLTACATLSGDGKTLHLIVFNKSTRQDIPARLRIAGFHAASARVWEVNGPSLSALDGVAETVHGAPFDMASKEPVHLFPAHSMTAIDFVVQAHP